MIVADTNVVAYYVIPNPSTHVSEGVRVRDTVWAAPALLRHELLSVLGGYIRQGQMDRDRAVRLYRRGISLVEWPGESPDPVEIFQMTNTSGCSTYDLEFVWLARELNVPLVTADREVVAAFPDVAIDISEFANG